MLAHEYGVDVGDLTATDAALLARTGDVAELVTDGLPPGWGRTLLVPAGGGGPSARRARARRRRRRRAGPADLGERDLDVLAPLLSALGVALRGAEHLSRLVEETGKLHAVVDHSSDGILVLDGEGRVQVWNRAMASISGVPTELAAGRSLRELLSTSDGDGNAGRPDRRRLVPAVAGDRRRRTVELALHRPDGEQRWIRASHAAVFADGAGRPSRS